MYLGRQQMYIGYYSVSREKVVVCMGTVVGIS